MTKDQREHAILILEVILRELKESDAQGSTFTRLSPAMISSLVHGIQVVKKTLFESKDE